MVLWCCDLHLVIFLRIYYNISYICYTILYVITNYENYMTTKCINILYKSFVVSNCQLYEFEIYRHR